MAVQVGLTAAVSGAFPFGNAKSFVTVPIRFNQNGHDTTFYESTPLAKPVMQIQSASVQALYFKW
jgi:hypothetical protein